MNINLASLKANLPKQEEANYLKNYTPGLFRAIEAAHYGGDSSLTDWNGFTLKEAELALEMAMNYIGANDLESEFEPNEHPNEGNAIHEYLHNTEVIFNFKRARPEKLAEESDFF